MPTAKQTKKLTQGILNLQNSKPKPIKKAETKPVEKVIVPTVEKVKKPAKTTPKMVEFKYEPSMPRHVGFGMKNKVKKGLKNNLYNKIK